MMRIVGIRPPAPSPALPRAARKGGRFSPSLCRVQGAYPSASFLRSQRNETYPLPCAKRGGGLGWGRGINVIFTKLKRGAKTRRFQ